MSKETDREYLLAQAEQKAIREREMFAEKARDSRKRRELSKREQLRKEIAQIRWVA
jgi:hypothetical protein